MATTGTIIAKNFALYKVGTPNVKITCQIDVEITMETATFDVTCKDSAAWAESRNGTKSWSATVNAFLAHNATEGFSEFFAAWVADTTYDIVVGTGVTGDKYLTGTTYITNLSQNSSGNDAGVQWSATLKGTGALTEATFS